MAIDVEAIVIDALLELVEGEGVPLERVTVKTLLERSGVSRQTFYNHFLDKNDLICQVYEQRMVPAFNDADCSFAYRDELVTSLYKMHEHGEFMRQACRMNGQNNLCDHMLERARKFDLAWHQRLVDGDLPEGLRLATNYHVSASVQITIAWILAGFVGGEEDLADLICQMRGIGFAAASMLVITLYIGNWFQKGRGTLTGLALSGSGIGSAIASPVVTACTDRFGYQTAYLGFVGFTILTIIPVMLLCPLTPQEVGMVPYGAEEATESAEDGKKSAADQALGFKLVYLSPTFIVLAVFVISIVLVTTLSGHMASLAQDYGYSAQVGALLLSASMVGNVVSKFALGAIADKTGAFKAIVVSLVTSVCGLVLILLNLGGQTALLASGFFYGACFSVGSLGISLLTRHIFGDAQYSDAYATISLVTSFASAPGVTAAGCLAYLCWRVTARPWERKRA